MNLMSLEEVKALEATVDMEYPPNRRGDALVLFDNLKQRGKAWRAFRKMLDPICTPFGIIATWLELTEYREVTEQKTKRSERP